MFSCHWSQACASYLVLNANQLANSKSHPGSIVVLGNYNETIIYAPSGVPAGPTRNDPPAVINTVATSDTGPERASAARLIKGLLLDAAECLLSALLQYLTIKVAYTLAWQPCKALKIIQIKLDFYLYHNVRLPA